MNPPLLSLRGLSKGFGAARAVQDLSLELHPGEILALIGPSGCGKTTTLRMIAGFEAPECGQILLAGRDITHTPPERRGIGIVFQDYALFPQMTVAANILFGAPDRGPQTLARFTAMVGLSGLEARYPDELSGGQQQRVALARALAAAPGLILLDEPFSNLDAALRAHTRREIRSLLRAAGCGILLVTHDQEEALGFADRLAVMRAGRLQQIGPPRALYDRPQNAFVARALGRANIICALAEGGTARTALGRVALVPALAPAESDTAGPVTLCIRPQDIRLTAGAEGHGPKGRIRAAEFRGASTGCLIEVIRPDEAPVDEAPVGEPLTIEVDLPFPLPEALRLEEGAVVGLGLRPGLCLTPLHPDADGEDPPRPATP